MRSLLGISVLRLCVLEDAKDMHDALSWAVAVAGKPYIKHHPSFVRLGMVVQHSRAITLHLEKGIPVPYLPPITYWYEDLSPEAPIER